MKSTTSGLTFSLVFSLFSLLLACHSGCSDDSSSPTGFSDTSGAEKTVSGTELPKAVPEKIVSAAKKAAAHDMILKLPEGYDTVVTTTGGRLSGGQIQRIGLARAMYDDPVFLVLDEPNSNLDNEGSNALNAAIRAMKAEEKSVIIMAHRPAAIEECDTLLVLENGTRVAFGPKDEAMRAVVKNHAEIEKSATPGGVS